MLKDTEFAYAVARIRANENKLLGKSVIESLINASSYSEALRILSEAGYGDFEKYDEDVILTKRQAEAFELICESAPDKNCLDFLIVKNDFHNIKAIIKAMVSGKDCSEMLMTPHTVDPKLFIKALESKDYSVLPEHFAGVVSKAYALVTETMDGQALEVYLDRECLEMSVYLAKRSKDEFSVKLSELMCALSDIKIALRCLKTGKDSSFVMNAIADCSLFTKKSLCDALADGEKGLVSFVKMLGFTALSEGLVSGFAAFEKVSDDMLIERIKGAKYQSLGIAPLVAYYFATDAEVKTVRIILSCKKNSVETEKIRERVRELYV